MPLDNVIYRTTPEVLETGFAGLRQLATELENQLPWNFTWDFSVSWRPKSKGCGSYGCAIGLAHELWPEQVLNTDGSYAFLLAIGLPERHWRALTQIIGYSSSDLYPQRNDGGILWGAVTPQMVAKELNRFCDEYA